MLDFRIKSSLDVFATVFHHASLIPYSSWDLRPCMYFYYILNDNDPLLNGFNKTWNGKWSETGIEAKVRSKTFVDTAAYKGKQFETKQNLNLR